MQNGACDYFPKNSINSDILAHAIHKAIVKYRSNDEEKRHRDDLEQLVVTDDLTGVYNRRYLTQSLDRECGRARRYRRDISCLMIDLDDFKKCNDTHSHLVGDMALKLVAAVIGESVREMDDVVRYGGEEFVVIMPETPRHAALIAADRIRSKLSERPVVVDHQPVRITVSIGVCTPGQDHDAEPELILACADAALLEAKESGKNRVCGSHKARQSVS
jgi:diguanylate cyclase (GGDEF)-like protein